MGLIGVDLHPHCTDLSRVQLIFLGGGFFNMLGGAYNAPAGYQRRLLGGIIRVKERWVLLLTALSRFSS